MRKTLFTLIALVVSTVIAMAQDNTSTQGTTTQDGTKSTPTTEATAAEEVTSPGRIVSGILLDKESGEGILQATVQLLKPADSTYVAGALSDMDGNFRLVAPADGKYIVKMTSIGYKDVCRNITISEGKDFAFGKVNLETDAVMLKEVIANGVAAKLVVKEDTFIYNAAAYRTPEGSVIEELVKRLPGAQVDDDGKITINGKEVKKIKVDGKEFMTGDTQTALKNLPTSIVEKVKAYDEKSDYSRLTGVDDGNESTVLDFGIKRGMNKGFLANIDLAAGTKNRYAERIFAGVMKDNSRLMVFGNANNTGDRGFSMGGRGGMGGGGGLTAPKMLGLNYNYEKSKVLRANFSVRWNHSDGDSYSTTATENFVSRTGSFSNSRSQGYSRSNSWNIGGFLEWTPDTATTINIRPSFTVSKSDSSSDRVNASFNKDPYSFEGLTDPLNAEYMYNLNKTLYTQSAGKDSLLINRNENKTLSYSTNTNFNISATINRKLNNNGRSITFQTNFATGKNDSESLSTQRVQLYRPSTEDSLYYRNRYNVTPNKNWSYSLQGSYNERLSRFSFLQLRYSYKYSNSTSTRNTYAFDKVSNFGYDASGNLLSPVFRSFNSFVGAYEPLYASTDCPYYDKDVSKYSEYDNYTHEIELTWRRNTEKYNMNLGVLYQPQSQTLTYQHLGLDTIARRSTSNITPTFDFRYLWNKRKTLRMTYRGYTSQPSMTDMLPITDDTDPLNITMGNPGLKPSFTQTMFLQYNNYVQSHMRTVMANVNFSNTRNSVSNRTEYNEQTGGRTTQPMNINGNWNARGAFMFNTAIDTVGVWNLNSFTEASYYNRVSYTYLSNTKETVKNHTNTTTLSERLGISYRNSWIEVDLNGNVTYNISRNKLQENANLDTWQFSYGTDITVTCPWGMSISTGAHMQSRRGYSDASANTNEFVWNAQLAQSFLKGKPLTVSLQFYDILNQRSSFSRTISAIMRSDSWTNSINNYAMLHVIYRFNAFGGSQARRGGRGEGEVGRPEGGRPEGGRPEGGRPEGGPPVGGMGGGRPAGGFGGGFGGR